MGLFGMIGGILGANAAKSSSRAAQAQQTASINQAIGTENSEFNTINQAYQPYTTAGTQALGAYGDLLGTNGAAAQNAAIQQLKLSPGYQQLYNTGQQTVLQNAAATGGLRGGNTEASLYNLGQQTLAQVIQNQLQGLGGLETQGLGATKDLSTFGANNANTIASLYNLQGNDIAQQLLYRGNLNAQMWKGLGGGLDSIASDVATGGISGALGQWAPMLGIGGGGGGGGFGDFGFGGDVTSGLSGAFSGGGVL